MGEQKYIITDLWIQDELKTDCCDDPEIIITKEETMVCINCGVTFCQAFLADEENAIIDPPHSITWKSFGPRTIISENKDYKNEEIDNQRWAKFKRLSKIQNSLVSSLERNYWEALPIFKKVVKNLEIPSVVGETAWRIYQEVAKQKLTLGRSIPGFILASVYAAIRVHEYPILFEEFTKKNIEFNIPIRQIHRSLGLIIRNVFPEIKLKYKPIQPFDLLSRLNTMLNLPDEVQNQAKKIINRISPLKKTYSSGIIAAALYQASQNAKIEISQVEIASLGNISEITLLKYLHQIQIALKEEI